MRTSLTCLVVTAMAACGGGSIDLDDFQSKLADAICSNAVTCGQMPDKATCLAATTVKSKGLQTTIAKAKSGTVKYDSDKAGDCIDTIAGDSCAFAGFYQPDTACATVFSGTVAVGAACVSSAECAGDAGCRPTDANCDTDTACCPGTCVAPPAAVAVGGDCTTADCVDTAYCNAMNRCAAPVTAAGASCDDLFACANPMFCDVFATTPTCVAPAARGATCDPMATIDCADSRDYCDETARKCTPNVAVGAACDGANGANCVGYADCTNMSCVASPKAGATCVADAMGRSNCLGDLDCTGGTCTLPAAATACRPAPELTPASTHVPPINVRSVRHTKRKTDAKRWMPLPRE